MYFCLAKKCQLILHWWWQWYWMMLHHHKEPSKPLAASVHHPPQPTSSKCKHQVDREAPKLLFSRACRTNLLVVLWMSKFWRICKIFQFNPILINSWSMGGWCEAASVCGLMNMQFPDRGVPLLFHTVWTPLFTMSHYSLVPLFPLFTLFTLFPTMSHNSEIEEEGVAAHYRLHCGLWLPCWEHTQTDPCAHYHHQHHHHYHHHHHHQGQH